MRYLIIILTFLMMGCEDNGSSKRPTFPTKGHPLKMDCIEVGPTTTYIYRCENKEALCYVGNSSESMQCKFKEQ